MFPEFTARTEFPRFAHPGTVTFVGTDGVERVELADHLPDWLKFAPGEDGDAVPVVRVVRVAGDRGYSIRSFGTDGRLLWVGLAVSAAAPMQPAQSEHPRPTPRLAHLRQTRTPALAAEPTGWF